MATIAAPIITIIVIIAWLFIIIFKEFVNFWNSTTAEHFIASSYRNYSMCSFLSIIAVIASGATASSSLLAIIDRQPDLTLTPSHAICRHPA